MWLDFSHPLLSDSIHKTFPCSYQSIRGAREDAEWDVLYKLLVLHALSQRIYIASTRPSSGLIFYSEVSSVTM
jgi:hypothetical protein